MGLFLEDAEQGSGAGEGSALCHPRPQQEQGTQSCQEPALAAAGQGRQPANADTRDSGRGSLNSAWKRRARVTGAV